MCVIVPLVTTHIMDNIEQCTEQNDVENTIQCYSMWFIVLFPFSGIARMIGYWTNVNIKQLSRSMVGGQNVLKWTVISSGKPIQRLSIVDGLKDGTPLGEYDDTHTTQHIVAIAAAQV